MGIRIKIFSGFLILSLMLALAGAWSVFELRSTGFYVQDLLDDNYRSIHAAREMIEALEREDSAILMLLLGEWTEGRAMLMKADSVFRDKLAFAYTNITVTGEQANLDTISARYKSYVNLWERPIVDTPKEGNLQWYFSIVHKSFLAVKASVNDLYNLNNQAMYQTSSDLKQRSNRAVMPGLIAIFAALLFSLIFNYFIHYYMVGPIIQITDRIRRFIKKRTPYEVHVESNDEISHLSESISQLCTFVESEKAR